MTSRPRVSSLTFEQFLRAYPRMAGAEGESGTEGQGGEGQGSQEGQKEQQGKTFDESYVKQLRGEAAGHRTKVGELEARLKEFEDRDKTELQKIAGDRDKHKGRAETAESRLARYEAAAKAGLDIKHANRIQGSTPAEMETDAKALAEEFGGRGRSGGFDGGAREGGTQQQGGMDGFIRRAAGRT